jgi:hypothetical protein
MTRIPLSRGPLALALLAAVAACGTERGEPHAPGDALALGTVEEIPSPAAPGSGEPGLTTGPDGRVYLSWLEPAPDSAVALRFALLEGGRWSAPGTVATGRDWVVNAAEIPALAVLPGGRMGAQWLREHPGGGFAFDVRVARSADGGATWGEAVTPHRDGTAAEHGMVSLFAAGGDSLTAIWLDGRRYAEAGAGGRGETMLMAATLAPDGSAGPDTPLDRRVCDCCQTAAALTSRGPLVAYRGRTTDEVRDVQVVRRVDGAWTAPRTVHADGWKTGACPVNGPQVSARGSRVAVAWFTAARDTPRVNLAFSDDAGATWGAPVRVDEGDPAGRVDVEVLDDGGALVSWVERAGGGAGTRLRRIGADGTPGPALPVDTAGAKGGSGFPRMARAGDAVVLAWTRPGSPSTLRTARIALGGAAQ